MVDDAFQPCRPACSDRQRAPEALGEDLPPTMSDLADKPHNGHLAAPAADLTPKIIESDESLTLSTANPLGTRDEIRSPVRMALIPHLENSWALTHFR